MDSLVRNIFENRTLGLYEEQGRALNEMREKANAKGMFHSGFRITQELEIRLKTAIKSLDALIDSYREYLTDTKTPITDEIAKEAKSEIDNLLLGKANWLQGEINVFTAQQNENLRPQLIETMGLKMNELKGKGYREIEVWLEKEKRLGLRPQRKVTGRTIFIIKTIRKQESDVDRFYKQVIEPILKENQLDPKPVDLAEGVENINA